MSKKALFLAVAVAIAAALIYLLVDPLDNGKPVVSGLLEMEAVDIYAPASGVVEEMPVSAGDKVSRGRLLIRIDPAELKMRIKRAVIEEREALKLSELAAQDYKKVFNQYESKKVPSQSLDRARATADFLYREYLHKKNIADGLNSILKKNAITSVYESVVLDARVAAGSSVKKGQHLMTVGFPGRLVLKAKVPDKYSGRIKLYGHADVLVPGASGKAFPGKVSEVSTEEVKVIIASDPGAGLKPGQKAKAELPLGPEKDK